MMTRPDDEPVAREHLEPEERDPEATTEDVAEQSRAANPSENGDVPVHLGDDASEWDAVEQSRLVELEDEDYR
jgi:hypothetical protein